MSRRSIGQRFVLSESGGATLRSYMEEIALSRVTGGRAALEDAGARWAARHRLEPEDALSLAEFKGAALSISDLVDRLDGLGPTVKSLRGNVERLIERGYLVLATSVAS